MQLKSVLLALGMIAIVNACGGRDGARCTQNSNCNSNRCNGGRCVPCKTGIAAGGECPTIDTNDPCCNSQCHMAPNGMGVCNKC
ncbi:unnamed protein product [Zymoseptoria tritici ST99CH_1A5]|uniref:Uncharacterized protein n=1 Tax=Zymoseptoria tritici ST99CH_1A5 TaxID=1276529 RepID=A0A1Y6LSV4_ZYMTR|nr:unnamed protein product [Zymoseptoria tritici ST99CH_1A5]